MKKTNKKGFTIVELVIVIAVIAILAGVLIPTFANVVKKANQSKALQEARTVYTQVMAEDLADGVSDGKYTNQTSTPAITKANIADCKGDFTYTAGTTFVYLASNGYKVTYTVSTNSWVTSDTDGQSLGA